MSHVVETVKVKSWGKGQGEFVEINKADFDPEKHELFKEAKGAKAKDEDKADGAAANGAAEATAGAQVGGEQPTAQPKPKKGKK